MSQSPSQQTLEEKSDVRKYPRDDEDRPDPTAVHSPGRRDDPETPPFLERIRPSTLGQWSAVFVILSFFASTFLYVSRLFPPGYHNPATLVIGLLVAGYPVVSLWFREQGFKARGDLDTVIHKYGTPSTRLTTQSILAKVESHGENFRYKEVKRLGFGGFVLDWLRLGDVVDPHDGRLDSKRHRDRDDPSFTEIDSRFTAKDNSEVLGDVYITDAGDLEYDFEAADVDRRTTPPEYLSKDATGMIITELQFAQRREDAAREEIGVLEDLLEDIRLRVEEEQLPELDRALKITDRVNRIHEQGRRRRRSANDIVGDDVEARSAVEDVDRRVDDQVDDGGRS